MKRAARLEELISPVSVDDFLDQYWEKTFLHVSGDSDRFSDLFSIGEIEHWMASNKSGPANSVVLTTNVGDTVETQRFRPEEARFADICAGIARESSLVLNHMGNYPSLIGTVKALSGFFQAEVNINAYLTPRNGKTFPIHTDPHDVLILHLAGEKIWHLHEFSVLQGDLKQKKNMEFTEEWYGRTETPEIAEVRLKPGDVLFMPRGMPHYAVATDSVCLHLTISIVPIYWMDVIKVMGEMAAVKSQDFRKAVPPGFVEDDTLIDGMRDHYKALMKQFGEMLSFDEVLATLRRNRINYQAFPPDGHAEQMTRLPELTIDSEVERRPDVLCAVDEVFDTQRNKKAAIFFGYQRVTGPLHLMNAFQFIRTNKKFRVSDIPGLDEEGQTTIARRLLVEGLLRLSSSTEESEQRFPRDAAQAS